MANKAYIVANEEQEREVLKKLYGQGYKWKQHQNGWLPQQDIFWIGDFPFCLFAKDNYLLKYGSIKDIRNHEIVYDGRKGSKMKISKEVYDALVEWKSVYGLNDRFTAVDDLRHLPDEVESWYWDGGTRTANNQRLLAIIRFAIGEQPFEIEKSKKWVVRSKGKNSHGDYLYATLKYDDNLTDVINCYGENYAKKFDTKEEAESWANAHQEVIEVEA
ncbi:hypothetical protein PWO95_02020 [Weissella paramesenteroides]|uniref:hypothetical protein n=1 Tax=Weissella paramesenteroides TaxID=1249 RepID=UPI0023A9813B|nr:hypothetical protein [Weissella paramesenteroides]WEA53355.1 hypothetical protein PWO95_02020 [Weissella paramesenteroides]